MSTHLDFAQHTWETTASKDELRALFLHSSHSPVGPFPTQEDALKAVEELKGAARAEAVDFTKAVTTLFRFIEKDWASLVPSIWEQVLHGVGEGTARLRNDATFKGVIATIRPRALLGLPQNEGRANNRSVLNEYPITAAGQEAYARLQQSAPVFYQHAEWDTLAERWGFSNRPWTQKRLLMPTLDQLLAYAETSAPYLDLRQHLSDLYRHQQPSLTYVSRWASKIERALPFVDFAIVPVASSTEALSRVVAFVSSIDANAPPFPSDLPSATALFGMNVLLQADLHRAVHQRDLYRISHRMARRIGTTKEAWETQQVAGMF
ncbi:hypothetical protein JCM10296v2_006201 [Rhodotorula toruloides]